LSLPLLFVVFRVRHKFIEDFRRRAKQNRPELPSGSTLCEIVPHALMTPTGFEPVSRP
jgi:hypothetical protein